MTMATRCIHPLRKVINISLTHGSTFHKHARLFSTVTPPKPTLPQSSAPWLRLPTDMNDPDPICYDNFLNIVDKSLVKLNRSVSYGKKINGVCVGSARGMLAFVSESNQYMFLVYPYSNGEIRCYQTYHGDDNIIRHSLIRYCTQAGNVFTILSEPLHDDHDSLAPHSYQDFTVLKPGCYRRWTSYPYLFQKEDPPLAYCAKTSTAYKLSRDSNQRPFMELWDMSDNLIETKSQFYIEPSSGNMCEQELRIRCHQDRYLVGIEDSSEAEANPGLYLVIRHHNRELGPSQTRAVDVFKIDLVGKTMTYTTKLEDHAFFIGAGSEPFAVSVKKCPDLKPNSIYISDDLRVFDLKNRSITPFVDIGDLSKTRLQTLWVPPPSVKQIKDFEAMVTKESY